MKQFPCRSAQQTEHLPIWLGAMRKISGARFRLVVQRSQASSLRHRRNPRANLRTILRPLAAVLLAIFFVMPLTAQEVRQPLRVLAAREVRPSISLRGEASQLQFVPTFRVVEDGDLPNVPLEPSPKIVRYFEAAAKQQIAEIDRACQLDERQKAKLKLAAMGDMSRFARETRETQEKYIGFTALKQPPQGEFAEDIRQLNTHLSEGVLREGAMFLMVLKSQLTPDQSQRLAREGFDIMCKNQAWAEDLSDEAREQLWALMQSQNEQCDEQPVLWTLDHCQKLVKELPDDDLAELLDSSQLVVVRIWGADLRARPGAVPVLIQR